MAVMTNEEPNFRLAADTILRNLVHYPIRDQRRTSYWDTDVEHVANALQMAYLRVGAFGTKITKEDK